MKKKKLISCVCLTAAFLLPFALVIAVILWGGVNAPFWDDWSNVNFYMDTVENGFSFSKLLVMYATVHRIMVPVVVRCLIWALTDCNVIVELVIAQGIVLFTVGLVLFYWKKRKAPLVMMLPVAAIVFSFELGMLQLWAMSMQWWLLVLFAIVSFYCYRIFDGNGRYRYLAISMVCAVLSAFCAANGLLIWIAYGVLFTAQKIFEKKRFFRKENVIVLLCGVMTFALFFFWGGWWLKLSNTSTSLWVTLGMFLRLIANPFFEADTPWLSYLYGVAALAAVGVLVYFVCAKREITKYEFPLLLVMFFFGSMLMIGYGRAPSEAVGTARAASSQYATSPAWAFAGAYLLFAELVLDHGTGRTAGWKNVLPVALYGMLLLVSIGKYPVARSSLDRMQADAYILQHWDEAPLKAKTSYVFPYTTVDDTDMDDVVSWIRENRLFLFGQEKEYEYPYSDYCFAEREYDFQYPDTEIEPGVYSIDGLNGSRIPDDRRVSITRDTGLSFTGWAVDNAHGACPSAVYVELDGSYYHMVPYERSDVAKALNNDAYVNSGVKGYVATDALAPGTYQVNVIVISADGGSYYTVPLLTVEITG